MTELNIPFEEILTPFCSEPGISPFYDFSPTAMVPCLYDADTGVWDSLAICEYLAEDCPGVWPADRKVRAWARSVVAEMHSGFTCLRNLCGMNIGVTVRLHDTPEELLAEVRRIDQIWQQGLAHSGGPFLTGEDFSAVDAFFAPVVFRCRTYDLPVGKDSAGYLKMMLSLDGMLQWESAALSETWRDESHELELHQCGKVIRDLRHSQG